MERRNASSCYSDGSVAGDGGPGLKVSILIPVFNEERTLDTLLDRVRAAVADRWPYEIVIIDDQSQDTSPDIIRAQIAAHGDIVAVLKRVNRGKGRAIREGLRQVTGDVVLIQDADLEYSPEDYPRLLAPIEEGRARVVFGSRFLDRTGAMTMTSRAANRALTALTNLLFHAHLTDMETCYKAFRADVILDLPLTADRFDIETELTAKTLGRGEMIIEVPISYDARRKSEGKKIGWRDGVAAVFSLVKHRLWPDRGEAASEVTVLAPSSGEGSG